LKRFILEGDIKYLNHWDICSLFVENAGKVFEDTSKEETQKDDDRIQRQ
jgi:hypothetical protein